MCVSVRILRISPASLGRQKQRLPLPRVLIIAAAEPMGRGFGTGTGRRHRQRESQATSALWVCQRNNPADDCLSQSDSSQRLRAKLIPLRSEQQQRVWRQHRMSTCPARIACSRAQTDRIRPHDPHSVRQRVRTLGVNQHTASSTQQVSGRALQSSHGGGRTPTRTTRTGRRGFWLRRSNALPPVPPCGAPASRRASRPRRHPASAHAAVRSRHKS